MKLFLGLRQRMGRRGRVVAGILAAAIPITPFLKLVYTLLQAGQTVDYLRQFQASHPRLMSLLEARMPNLLLVAALVGELILLALLSGGKPEPPVNPIPASRPRKGALDFLAEPEISPELTKVSESLFADIGAIIDGPASLLAALTESISADKKRKVARLVPKIAKWHERRIPHLRDCIDRFNTLSSEWCQDHHDRLTSLIEDSSTLSMLRQRYRDMERLGDLRPVLGEMVVQLNVEQMKIDALIRLSSILAPSLGRVSSELGRLKAIFDKLEKAAREDQSRWTAELREKFASEHKAQFQKTLDDPVAVRILLSFSKTQTRFVDDVAQEFQQEPWQARVYLGRMSAEHLITPVASLPYVLETIQYRLDQEGRRILNEMAHREMASEHTAGLSFSTESVPVINKPRFSCAVRLTIRTSLVVQMNWIVISVDGCVENVKTSFTGTIPKNPRVTIAQCDSSSDHTTHHVTLLFSEPPFLPGVNFLVELSSANRFSVLGVERQEGSQMLRPL